MKNRQHQLFALLGILLFAALPVRGCDYCLLTQGISPLETAKGIGFRVDQRYARLGALFEAGSEVESGDALETHWTTQLTAFYSVTPRLTVTAVVPFARRFEQGEEGHHGEGAPDGLRTFLRTDGGEGGLGTSFGLSDITLLGRYQVFNRHTFRSTFIAALQTGVRLPTGKTDATNDEGEFLNAHIQPGTGAVNYLLGISTSYAVNRLSLIANGVYSIATEGEVGDHTYEYGNAVNYEAAVRYRLTRSIQSPLKLFAGVGIAGEYRGEEFQDNVLAVGRGHTIYAAPSFQVFFEPLVFEFAFWQPIFQDMEGDQLAESFKTFGGLTFLLR